MLEAARMQVRIFKEGDGPGVKELVDSIMKGEFGEESGAYPEDDLLNIPKTYGGPKDVFLVACEGGSVVGTAAIKGDSEDVALLRRLFVHPAYRQKGYGRRLLKKTIDFCRGNGYRVIVFRSTDRMAQANNLCRKMGFVERARVNFGGFEILKFTFSCSSTKR